MPRKRIRFLLRLSTKPCYTKTRITAKQLGKWLEERNDNLDLLDGLMGCQSWRGLGLDWWRTRKQRQVIDTAGLRRPPAAGHNNTDWTDAIPGQSALTSARLHRQGCVGWGCGVGWGVGVCVAPMHSGHNYILPLLVDN